ncbi:MAG: hypothetical protein WC332_00950 [Clostridia bacterium]|jgi:hypothetical protein
MGGSELIIILVVFSYICLGFVVFNFWKENKTLRVEIKDLLNRLMARTYPEYARFELEKEIIAAPEEKKKSLLEQQDVFPVN